MSQSTNEPPDEQTCTVELTVRDRHRLLAAPRRQLALEIVAGTTSISLEELAAEIDAREAGHSDDAERTAVSLHHIHLPMLDEKGVLDYDVETHLIEPSDSIEGLL